MKPTALTGFRLSLPLALGLGLLLYLLAAVVARGQTLAGLRDELVDRFAGEHLVPAISVGTNLVRIGPVALSPSGGPAEVQSLWVAGQPPPTGGGVVGWESVIIRGGWLALPGDASPMRVEVRGWKARLDRPEGALAAWNTLRRLLPSPASAAGRDIVVAGGEVRIRGPHGEAPLSLADLAGRATVDGNRWLVELEGTAADGEPVRVRFRAEDLRDRPGRVHVEVEHGARTWSQILGAPSSPTPAQGPDGRVGRLRAPD